MNRQPIVGIIAEYNPFHNGHLYQLEQAKALTGASRSVIAMSGHFLQRGEPAMFSTAVRTKMALQSGADAVFEMPAPFSTAAAPDFALYGVSLFDALGVRYLSCGTENADAEEITGLAEILSDESPAFRNALQYGLKNGLSYPVARSRAVAADLSSAGADDSFIIRTQELLSTPNNILAIEYARANLLLGSPLTLVTVNRKGSSYSDRNLSGTFSSAGAIRRYILNDGDPKLLQTMLPAPSLELVRQTPPVSPDAFVGSVCRRVIDLLHEGRSLADFADVPEDLANRIAAGLKQTASWEEFVAAVKTRQYTAARISRALIHLFLGLTDGAMQAYKAGRAAPYARLTGFRHASEDLLSLLKQNAAVPLISKAADASGILKNNPAALSLLLEEAHAADLWNSVYFDVYRQELPGLYEEQIVIV